MSLLKQNNIVLLLIFFILLLVISPFFSPGIPFTHDGEVQIARFGAYMKAFQDSHIPPRWAGDLNYRYGSPVLNFYYPLPGYLASVFSLLPLSLEHIFKMIFMSTFFLSTLSFFLWIRNFKNIYTSGFLSLLYSLAPYQLLNAYVRGDIGESLALALLPLFLYTVERYKKRETVRTIVLSAFVFSSIILSHHGIALMMLPLMFLYTALRLLPEKFLGMTGIFVLGFGIAGFFWIPALIEHRYTLASQFIGDMFQYHFTSLTKLIYAPWNFGPKINEPDGLAPQLGLVITFLLLVSLLISIINIIRKKSYSILSLLFISFMLVSLLLTVPLSTEVWQRLPLLHKYQFPWRFVALATISSIGFISLQFPKLNKIQFILMVILLFLTTISYLSVKEIATKADLFYLNYPGTTFFHEEAATIWSTGSANKYPDQPIEIIAGTARIEDYQRVTQRQSATIIAKTPTQIKMNTLYYPGWRAFVNNIEVPIQFQDPNNRGLITFTLPEGSHKVMIIFSETKFRMIANTITLGSIVLSLGLLLIHRKKKHV